MSAEESFPAFRRLVEIMAVLRSPEGCPWDREQSPESLKPYLIEECYEVLQALDSGDPARICDELGDLLLQIVFHARIFEERQAFDIEDVARTISEKLERRHPHVFAEEPADDAATLDAQWERIKAEERASRGEALEPFAGIAPSLPALARAQKVLRKAAREMPATAGPQSAPEALAALRQRLDLLEADKETRAAAEAEFGDLLLAAVELGLALQLDAEEVLRLATDRFISRLAPARRMGR